MARQTFEEFRKAFNARVFDTYKVEMTLRDIAGGTPADPQLIRAWVEAKCKDKTAEEREKIVSTTLEALPEVAEQEAKSQWCRFKRDEKGVYIEGRQLKAGLKEAANIVKKIVGDKDADKPGITALKSKVAECVFVSDEKVYLLRNGSDYITDDVPSEERPVHVMTRMGPRTALKRSDVLRDITIKFQVRLAQTGAVSEEALFSALAYLEHLGIGADRSQGRGVATSIKCERLN